jgi:hypothetical protein
MAGPTETVRKARLSSTAQHPRAVPALAMWGGQAAPRCHRFVHHETQARLARRIQGAPLYELELVRVPSAAIVT